MRVWLDDERDPTDPKIQELFGAVGDEVWVKTVSEALEFLRGGEVESISLDNDLGLNQEEGYKVADWIEEKAHEGRLLPLDVFIHSANSARRSSMKMATQNAITFWVRNH